MTNQQIGILTIAAGAVIVVIGLVVWAGGLRWFGQLPGDIKYEGERTRVYFPVMSMVLISVVISVLIQVIRRIVGK